MWRQKARSMGRYFSRKAARTNTLDKIALFEILKRIPKSGLDIFQTMSFSHIFPAIKQKCIVLRIVRTTFLMNEINKAKRDANVDSQQLSISTSLAPLLYTTSSHLLRHKILIIIEDHTDDLHKAPCMDDLRSKRVSHLLELSMSVQSMQIIQQD